MYVSEFLSLPHKLILELEQLEIMDQNLSSFILHDRRSHVLLLLLSGHYTYNLSGTYCFVMILYFI